MRTAPHWKIWEDLAKHSEQLTLDHQCTGKHKRQRFRHNNMSIDEKYYNKCFKKKTTFLEIIAMLQTIRSKKDKYKPTIAGQVADNDGMQRCCICCRMLTNNSKNDKPDVTWCLTRSEYNLGDLTQKQEWTWFPVEIQLVFMFCMKNRGALQPSYFLASITLISSPNF